MDNNEYKKTLSEIRTTLTETTKPIDYIDTSKMSKKEKDNLIIELQNKIHSLQSQLLIRKSVDERYINGLIQSKYDETMNLIHNPVLTLPSGTQIQFSSLWTTWIFRKFSRKTKEILISNRNYIECDTSYDGYLNHKYAFFNTLKIIVISVQEKFLLTK